MIGKGGASRGRRVKACALGTSAMTLAMVLAGAAQAQCTPDPTVANGTTTCTGTDADGIAITTAGTRVEVTAGAAVRGSGGPAVDVRPAPGPFGSTTTSVDVAGTVDGDAQAGVGVVAQRGTSAFATYQTLNLSVAEGGVVTGATGVTAQGNPADGRVEIALTNAGTISGTGGVALRSGGSGSFTSITNRAGGSIGAIEASVGTLDNAGTLEGGATSAVAWRAGDAFFGNIRNTGAIGSTSIAATLAGVPTFRSLTNDGTIVNRGTGAAVEGTALTLTNNAGARIASAGATAIRSSGSLQLTNTGTIDGDVVITASGFGTSRIDSRDGRINGALTLGANDDILVARYDAGVLATGVGGAIDGGAGVDTVQARFAANATLAAPIALPTAFERLSIMPATDATVTLANGFAAPGALILGGTGTIVNDTALTAAQQVVTSGPFLADGYPAFVNNGTIATGAGTAGVFAVSLNSGRRFENNGTITATGDGVLVSASGDVANTGTITAAGTALSVFAGAVDNSGTIASTGGIGASFSGSFNVSYTNAGRTEGAVAGMRLGGTLVNTGTVTSPRTGIQLQSYGVVDNRAGGVISGGTAGIAPGPSFDTVFAATIANAGRIDGDVVLSGGSNGSFYNGNRYFALPGGVLNGNLTLGREDTLIAEFGAGAFAGITGTVTGAGSLLRYRVRGTASGTLTSPAGFAATGYDLFDNAALTLTGSAPALQLAGRGSVDLTADIAVTGGSAVQVTSVQTAPGESQIANALAITSRGTLSLARTSNDSYSYSAVVLGGEDSFTNAGTIVAADRATTIYNRFSAVVGASGFVSPSIGTVVTNTGTITLDGTVGIRGVRTITNSGTIGQVAGGRAAVGIEAGGNAILLTNSGTIDVAGYAVLSDYYGLRIENSGRIASSGDIAIATSSYATGSISNLAGGTIAGAAGKAAIRLSGGYLSNAGTITGDVDLGYNAFGRSYFEASYVADGGAIAGNLLFGDAADTLISFGEGLGVSGTIDGGGGIDTVVHARRASATVTLTGALPTGFEREGVRSLGGDTTVTVRADAAVTGDLLVSGDGAIVNTATIRGAVSTRNRPDGFPSDDPVPVLAGFTNQGTIAGGFDGETLRFVNAGTIGSAALSAPGVSIRNVTTLAFSNDGGIATSGTGDFRRVAAAELTGYGEDATSIAATNAGTIAGGFDASLSRYVPDPAEAPAAPLSVALTNDGTITGSRVEDGTVALRAGTNAGTPVSVTLDNRGTIDNGAAGGAGAVLAAYHDDGVSASIAVTNAGTIRANAGGQEQAFTDPWSGYVYRYTDAATALVVEGSSATTATVTNAATGTIEATGTASTTVAAYDIALDLANAGTIRGSAGSTIEEQFGAVTRSYYLPGAILAANEANDRIVNTGTIIGSIDLDGGDDRIENYGRIEGDVFLGAGNDTFLHRASAALIGTVDGGEGADGLVIDATGGGTVDGGRFVNFERFGQTGAGNVTYLGNFRLATIGLAGGTLTVAAGQTLSSTGATTVTGSDGADTVVNQGTIAGAVALGAGNDRFVEGVGSGVLGTLDGGSGDDTYAVALAGNRGGIGARTGFERLAVEGRGTLSLALDQDFRGVSLAGTGLAITSGGFAIGTVTGSDGDEAFATDTDVASVSLGAGNDTLSLGTTLASGNYAGGAGTDVLRFTAAAPVTLAGNASGFEQVALVGNALTVGGTLGAAGAPLAFDGGSQRVEVARTGTLAGVIDLGAGNDALRLAAGSTLNGSVSGGGGDDVATLELVGDRSVAGMLTGFETLATEGSGTLTLTGAHAYGRVLAGTNLAVGAAGALSADVRFGAANDRLAIAGAFAGAVDGGAGTDAIAVSGGSAAAPVAFAGIAGVEAFGMSGGYATIAGNAALGAVDMSGGRLVGLAGSLIAARDITVRQGATFGSAGTVNGNIAVAGILSPGASPGTMTVNGNVALAGSSLSLFELTPTISDRLVVNGAVTIAPGATLQLVSTGTLRPGTSYDLVVASGGITGGYTNVLKPDALFGFVVQRADRIQLLGQFLGDPGFSPQVARSVAYANRTLAVQPATSALFAALPSLLTASGASDARAFARLTPEPYASATQLGVDKALTLTQAARGPAFATTRDTPGLFTFGEAVGQWHTLGADPRAGTAKASTRGYGFLGGIGFGDAHASFGAFAGYLDARQRIGGLGAATKADGFVAGVHGRYDAGALGVTASVLYDGGDARTTRFLPDATTATGRYDLHSWVADLSVGYALDMAADWSLRPKLGVTYLRTTRDGLGERGGPFALDVSRDRHVAGFVDGGVTLARSTTSDAAFRPFVGLGVRYQVEGRRTDALAGYSGGALGLEALGAARARAVGTASAGLVYRLAGGLDLFSTASAQTGRDDHRETISTGVRLRF